MIRIAINGMGRVGRLVFRQIFDTPGVEVVAINGRSSAESHAHLTQYDSVHGTWNHHIEVKDDDTLVIEGKEVRVLKVADIKDMPWKELNVDVVVEATGIYKKAEQCQAHIDAGAKKVVITAPAKGEDITIVMGVNDQDYDHAKHHIVSCASCTTNCLAPVAKVLDEKFGIKRGFMTTIHAYTNDQKTHDKTHKDFRRARAAGLSMIPTTTGAAKAVAKVLPQLEGKLNGFAVRVPTPNVSMVDLVVDLKQKVTADQVNAAFKEASEGSMKGILGYNELPLVSVDYNNCPISTVVDGLSTMVMEDDMVKVLAWYDNEWGYACRVLDLAMMVAGK